MYCFYTASFLVATVVPESAELAVVIIGSTIGGIGAGFLWTAQGLFYGRTAELYAEASGTTKEDANSKLAGIFAFFYVGLEVVLKLLSSLLNKDGLKVGSFSGQSFVYLVFTVLAVGSAIVMLFIKVGK